MRSPRLATWFYLNHNVHILALVLKREVWECHAAYNASRATIHELCMRICPQHKGTHEDSDNYLQHAMESLQAKLPRSEILTGELERITQNKLNKEIDKFTIEQWKSTSKPAERVHLQAYYTLGCGHKVDCAPSKSLYILRHSSGNIKSPLRSNFRNLYVFWHSSKDIKSPIRSTNY